MIDENILTLLAKKVLATLGLADEGISEWNLWFRNSNTSSMKWENGRYYEIVKSLIDSDLLMKSITKTIES